MSQEWRRYDPRIADSASTDRQTPVSTRQCSIRRISHLGSWRVRCRDHSAQVLYADSVVQPLLPPVRLRSLVARRLGAGTPGGGPVAFAVLLNRGGRESAIVLLVRAPSKHEYDSPPSDIGVVPQNISVRVRPSAAGPGTSLRADRRIFRLRGSKGSSARDRPVCPSVPAIPRQGAAAV